MRHFKVASLATALALGVAAPVAAGDPAYPEIDLRFALFINSTLPQSKNFQIWADELNKRSNGKINVKFFWSESLGKATELLDLVESGAVDLIAPAPAYFPTELPLTNVTQLPATFPTAASAQLSAEGLDQIAAVRQENANNNIVPLFWTSIPPYHILCNDEIRTLADFKGKKMRSYGEYVPQMWEALGAVGVTTTSPEVYEGLQRGLLDCSYLPDDFSYAYKLHEVAKYYIDANFGAIIGWPVYLNADLWNSWPEEVRQIFIEVSAEAAERDRQEIGAIGEKAAQAMLDAGLVKVEFEEPERLHEAIPDILGIWVAEMSTRGLGDPAKEIADQVRARVAEAAN